MFGTCDLVLRFSQTFESKVADVDSAMTRLNSLTQRLAFAKGRVETVQGATHKLIFALDCMFI